MIAARDRDVSVNGLRLHYLEWGIAGRQPMLLLHGGSAHAHWWDFLAPRFIDHYHVLALDLRGHGDSQWANPPEYGLSAHADDVRRFIETLGLTDLVLAGHSFGGLVAITCAPRVIEHLASLITIDIGGRISKRGVRYMSALRLLPHPVYASADEAIRRFRLLPTANGARPEVLAHMARHAIRQRGDGTWTLKFDRRTLGNTTPCDLVPVMQTLRVPMLVVRGSESTYFTAHGLGELAAVVPHARTVEIAGAHHHVMLDAPEALADAVRSFLVSVRARPGCLD